MLKNEWEQGVDKWEDKLTDKNVENNDIFIRKAVGKKQTNNEISQFWCQKQYVH